MLIAFACFGKSALRSKVKTYFVAIRQNLFGKPEQILGKKHEKSALSVIFQPPRVEAVELVGYAKRSIRETPRLARCFFVLRFTICGFGLATKHK